MLRISEAPTSHERATLRLEGEITGRWVQELRRECVRAIDAGAMCGSGLVLDVGGVLSIDGPGLALFRELGGRGVLVKNASLYIAALLAGIVEFEA